MRIATPSAFVVALLATNAHAAPALDSDQQLSFQSPAAASGLESLTFGLTSKISSAINRVFSSHLTSSSATLNSEQEDKTIWEVINESEEFSQLAHVHNYSSDATKDIVEETKAQPQTPSETVRKNSRFFRF